MRAEQIPLDQVKRRDAARGDTGLSEAKRNESDQDLQRLRNLCRRAGITLFNVQSDDAQHLWGWHSATGNASQSPTLKGEWAAALHGLETIYGDVWNESLTTGAAHHGLIRYIEVHLDNIDSGMTTPGATDLSPQDTLALQLVDRYRGIADNDTAIAGELLHAQMAQGAISDYFDPNTGGGIWLSHSIHQGESGNVLVTAGLDSVYVYRALTDQAQSCADAVYALCGEDDAILLAKWYYEAPVLAFPEEEFETPRP